MLPSRWVNGRVAVAFVADIADRRFTARQHVAALLDRPASGIELRREPTGKPVLDAPAGASCSFARRDGVLMVAASESGKLGVDLEVARPDLDAGAIARSFFSRAEADWLSQLGSDQHILAFTAVWCVKEAVLKATGTGITAGMNWPTVEQARVRPLLQGVRSILLSPAAGMIIELHRFCLGAHHAFACVAFDDG